MRAALVTSGLAIAAIGCTDYAHVSIRNAPGDTDLGTPSPRENGDPHKFDAPTDPGFDTVTVFAAPYVVGGTGRYRPGSGGAGEAGLEFRVERARGARLAPQAWAVTAGVAFAQWGDAIRTTAPGAFYGELGYRFFANVLPIDLGLGPAFYVDNPSAGGQLTARIAILMVRARYLANTGFELFAGAEIPVPFFFSWSR